MLLNPVNYLVEFFQRKTIQLAKKFKEDKD
jgi:hypothetical protein